MTLSPPRLRPLCHLLTPLLTPRSIIFSCTCRWTSRLPKLAPSLLPPHCFSSARPSPYAFSSARPVSTMPDPLSNGLVLGADSLQLQNTLSQSRSPYVRAHMNNPVAWQTWGPEALALAKKHDRMLFISIGYAACHWCHVMERESFENHEIAKLLNENFVPIKVDREERPDIDRIYMNFVQATNGHGGWPMSVFVTPDLEPVYGGTYWPGPASPMVANGQHPGFAGILDKVINLWKTQREKCVTSAKSVTVQLREFAQEGSLGGSRAGTEDGDGLELETIEEAYEYFEKRFDPKYGGFGGAPKFPTPSNLAYLLLLPVARGPVQDVVGHEECKNAKDMAISTLRNMTRGGIHDQIGHGFARYSVTKDWSLPHFEKMLYDQGQLLSVYLDAFLETGDAEMLGAVYDIAKYLTEPPLAAPEGGFYSSEDADSYHKPGDTEKHEGAYYVWTSRELQQVLGERDAAVVGEFYNVRENGNVAREHDAHDELVNQNVLAVSLTPEAIAKQHGLNKTEVVNILKEARKKLRAHREKERPRPGLDDKIVVGWNGLAIGALARASSVLASVPGAELAIECREAATRAVSFIKKNLYNETNGRLTRVYREGPGDAPGFADDYAFFIQGLLETYEATFDDSYLEFADKLQKTQIELFWDTDKHGFFSTQVNQPDIIMRLKDGMDNAEPSTNGVSASNLYRLASILEDEEYRTKARQTLAAFATEMSQHPFLFTSMMVSVSASKLGVRSAVITGEGAEVEEAVKRSRLTLKPNTTVTRIGGQSKSSWLVSRNKLVANMDPNKPSVQVCQDGMCKEALSTFQLDKALKEFPEDVAS